MTWAWMHRYAFSLLSYHNQRFSLPLLTLMGLDSVLSGNVTFARGDLRLYLNNNSLKYIDMDIFNDSIIIRTIDISDNQLTQCPSIKYLLQLTSLCIRGNPLTDISRDTFNILRPNRRFNLFVSQHEICECYLPDGFICHAAFNRSPYLTCYCQTGHCL